MPSDITYVIGGIYWFVNPQISSPEPHPHICVGEYEGTCILMMCGTSQFEKRRRYFELNNLPFETLVRIQANKTNTITKDTFVDCSQIQVHKKSELLLNTTLAHKGIISDAEMYQLKNGVDITDLLEEKLKKHIIAVLPDV